MGFPFNPGCVSKKAACIVEVKEDSESSVFCKCISGAGRGEQNLVYIKESTGFGAGLLVDGKVYGGGRGPLFVNVSTAMLGRRPSSMGAVIQALTNVLNQQGE